ncbi:hypothetical protein DEFDS_P154 (plasmid) [Deferribacter desulfuricans SSM1]|uniref:Uncharacterized protein n=1 Tax=Deferribacter desulfuricans (strain DSM 14783 / JCM 11476 / NBRC 101012 / SSM1) TaxID=639282 RepID=D3PEY3_DEFDS|nr:hypothetical protein [Deferribacter desulfuricans]BAI81775.1 hypothetical protein DEFDS_P154 [Deferribacter desulfuricans SSM1]
MTYEKVLKKVRQGSFFKDKKILKLANETGWTIAHEQAKRSWTTEDKEILNLMDSEGWTVAHEQAWRGWTTDDKDILKLVNFNDYTVAQIQIENNWATSDIDIIKLKISRFGRVLAHGQSRQGWIIMSIDHISEVLKLKDENNWTVAHELVFHHKYKIKYKKILTLLGTNNLLNYYSTSVYMSYFLTEEFFRHKLDYENYIYPVDTVNITKLLKHPENLIKNRFGNQYFKVEKINKEIEFYKKLDFEIKKYLLINNIC